METKKDRIVYQINDLFEHKKYVLDSCKRLSLYLIESENEVDLALELLKRAAVHDNSKLESEEFDNFIGLKCGAKAFVNAQVTLNNYEKEKIQLHWKNNRHHPEHFNNVQEMSKLDILEMICDWDARSRQYQTDLIEFVETRQENRFHFPEEMFKTIMYYCNIIKNLE